MMDLSKLKLEEPFIDSLNYGIVEFDYCIYDGYDDLFDRFEEIRREYGNTDMYTDDNDVYYCFFVSFNITKRSDDYEISDIELYGEPYNSEKDEFNIYFIPLSNEEVKPLIKILTEQFEKEVNEDSSIYELFEEN